MLTRSLLERITSSLVISLTSIVAFGAILLIADGIFAWDVFPPEVSLALYFIGASCLVIIMAATLINVMLNISRLSESVGILVADKTKRSSKNT